MIHPTRFIGLDIHKEYLVASGVDHDQNQIFGPVKVTWGRFENSIRKNLNRFDAVALEMTTNSWQVHYTLEPHVNSVTIVHPPDVALIVKAQVKTDKPRSADIGQAACCRSAASDLGTGSGHSRYSYPGFSASEDGPLEYPVQEPPARHPTPLPYPTAGGEPVPHGSAHLVAGAGTQPDPENLAPVRPGSPRFCPTAGCAHRNHTQRAGC